MEKERSKYKTKIMIVIKMLFSLKVKAFDTKSDDETKKTKNRIPKMNGTKCEINARFACERTSISLLIKNISNGTMNGAKKMLK